MSITATTKGKNRVARSTNVKTLFESMKPVVSAAVTFYQGDLICLDGSSKLLRPVAATGDVATFLGVAPVSVLTGILIGPYQGLSDLPAPAVSDARGPEYGASYRMKLHVGDAFQAGALVYLSEGDDCQTVTSTNPGDSKAVGLYVGSFIAAAVAGQEGECLIGMRYIGDTLHI